MVLSKADDTALALADLLSGYGSGENQPGKFITSHSTFYYEGKVFTTPNQTFNTDFVLRTVLMLLVM